MRNSNILYKKMMSQSGSKEKLILAMVIAIAKKGSDNVTIDEILKEAKLTKPVLYYHFKDKDELTEELFKISVAHFKEKMSELRGHNFDVEAIIFRVVDSFYCALTEFPGFANLYVSSIASGARKNTKSKFLKGMYKLEKHRQTELLKLFSEFERKKVIKPGSGKKLLSYTYVIMTGLMTEIAMTGRITISKEDIKLLLAQVIKFLCLPGKDKK